MESNFKITAAHHYPEIFSEELVKFLIQLHKKFNQDRLELLSARKMVQQNIDGGVFPKFPEETAGIREENWVCSRLPKDLQDRRVEITGPVDRKMIINALNSGASTFMADFEDSNSPTWGNCMEGQINLSDAINRTIDFVNEEGKAYQLGEKLKISFHHRASL